MDTTLGTEPYTVLDALRGFERDPAAEAAARNWLIQAAWRNDMAPEGSASRAILEATRINDPLLEATALASLGECVPKERFLRGLNLPWQPTEEEALLPVDQEMFRRMTLALHALTDEYRLTLMGIILTYPDGAYKPTIMGRFAEFIHPEEVPSEVYRYAIERWLINNKLVEVIDRNNKSGKCIKATADGLALAPFIGHSLAYMVDPKNPTFSRLLGYPKNSMMAELTSMLPPGRQQLDHIADMAVREDQLITVSNLATANGASEEITITFINRLVDLQWLVVVPGDRQPREHYPLLIPGILSYSGVEEGSFTSILSDYLTQLWAEDSRPINLYDLMAEDVSDVRKQLSAMIGSGDDWELRRIIAQEIARLRSLGQLRYARGSNLRAIFTAINPAKVSSMNELVTLVRGAEQHSDRYHITGSLKLRRLIDKPSPELTKVLVSKRRQYQLSRGVS